MDHKFPMKNFIGWNLQKIIPANLSSFTVAKLVIRCVLKVQNWDANHLSIYLINAHHTTHLLYVCHIVIIYCTHCSITLVDCVMLLVMVDWRMSRNISRMEWMLIDTG